MAEPAKEPPRAINPYKALGVATSTTTAEVKTAYKKLALKHHPDKVAHAERTSAHTKFQEIAFAYAILSDPVRRNRYDTTGSTSESVSDDFNWKSFFKAQFAETVTADKLNNLKSTYQGSEEEKRDVLEAYKRRKGSLNRIFKDIMLSNPLDDEDRFKSIIDAALAAGDVEPFRAYQNADAQESKERRRRAEKEGKEAEEYAKELGVHDALFCNGRPEGKEKKGLADLINQRQKARAATFLDDLTAKYINGTGKDGVRKEKKRKSEDIEDDNPPSNGRSRKKGKLTRGGTRKDPRKEQHRSQSEDDDQVDQDKQSVNEPSEEAFQKASRPSRDRKPQVVEEDSDDEESLGDDDTEEELDEGDESEEEVKPKKKTKTKTKPKPRKKSRRNKMH